MKVVLLNEITYEWGPKIPKVTFGITLRFYSARPTRTSLKGVASLHAVGQAAPLNICRPSGNVTGMR